MSVKCVCEPVWANRIRVCKRERGHRFSESEKVNARACYEPPTTKYPYKLKAHIIVYIQATERVTRVKKMYNTFIYTYGLMKHIVHVRNILCWYFIRSLLSLTLFVGCLHVAKSTISIYEAEILYTTNHTLNTYFLCVLPIDLKRECSHIETNENSKKQLNFANRLKISKNVQNSVQIE